MRIIGIVHISVCPEFGIPRIEICPNSGIDSVIVSVTLILNHLLIN